MALKATIFKADLQISDMDRNYYGSHSLTLARHPSETDERMMVRLLAFAIYASEALAFTKGISTDDEPDLWQKSLSDEIELWIEMGQPDERRIRKACARAKQVVLISFGGRSPEIWWRQIQDKLTRFENLRVINIPAESCAELSALATRSMQLQCSIQDGQIWLSANDTAVEITPNLWMM